MDEAQAADDRRPYLFLLAGVGTALISIALAAALFGVNEEGLLPPVPPNRRRLPLRQRLRLG